MTTFETLLHQLPRRLTLSPNPHMRALMGCCTISKPYMRPLTIVLVGDGSDMFCGGRLRVGRRVVEADEGVGYERPFSLPTRVATSMLGVGYNDGKGNGCCRSCTRDMAI